MKLYAHQQKIIDEDPAKTGLFLGTGSGKTRLAILLSRGRVLVIAPKTQVEDRNWQRELQTILGEQVKRGGISTLFSGFPKFDVISKETFRRDHEKLGRYDTVIVDEAHTCLGVTPNVRWRDKKAIPKASQLYEALDAYLERTDPERLYLCTATIMRSPMTVWAAARLLNRKWNWHEFRSAFYVPLPMPGREVWVPRSDSATKDRLAAAVRKIGYVGRLEDFFDVPEQTFRTIHVDLTEKQKKRIKEMKLEYPEQIVRVGKIHQIENGVLAGDEFNEPEIFDNNKIDKILDLASEFPRMVIFAKYKAQISHLRTALKDDGHTVLTLTGDTKNRGALISMANSMQHCIFIAQAQISAGWELPEYPVMVFASRTYSFVDYDQAIGRIQRANFIKKNLYLNLVVKGGVDEAVDKAIANKQDFNDRLYELPS